MFKTTKLTATGIIVALLVIAACITAAFLNEACVGGESGGETQEISGFKLVFKGEGVNIAPIDISSGGAIKLPRPERPGYTFEGWFIDKDYTMSLENYLASNVVTGDVTAYAKWEAVAYILNVGVNNPNAGSVTVNGGAEEYAEYEAEVNTGLRIELSAVHADEDAYDFIGWYEFDGESWTRVDSAETYIFTVASESVTLEARWTGGTREVKFYRNYSASDDEIVLTKTFAYGDSFTVKPEVRQDYLFTGWYADRECSEPVAGADGKFVNYEQSQYSISLYAGWKAGNTTLIIDASVGSVTGYDPESASEIIHIPASFDGSRVTGIKSFAFEGFKGCVVVPGTVTEIEDNAFGEGTTVLFDADYDTDEVLPLADGVAADGAEVKLHLFVYMRSRTEYPAYVECGKKIYDTVINSKLEFTSVVGYLWLYNFGTEFPETFVPFDFSQSGLPESSVEDTVFGQNEIIGSWLYDSFAGLGLKSDTVSFSYSVSGYNVKLQFNSLAEGTVASQFTSGNNLSVQTESVLADREEYNEERSFAIDSLPEFTVYNSEQLVYAAENGYRPRFGTLPDNSAPAAVNALNSAKEVYRIAREALLKTVSSQMSDYEKVLAIHDYIALNVSYDFELYDLSMSSSESLSGYRGFSPEGVFIDKRAVCDGIAKAFMLMARIEGIETVRVSGTLRTGYDTIGHAWNKVRLDNAWYAVDVTGDDMQVSFKNSVTRYEMLTHRYFLVSDSYLETNGYTEDGGFYPEAIGEYQYYVDASLDALGEEFAGKKAVFYNSDALSDALEAARLVADEILDRSGADMAVFEFYWDSAVEFNVTMTCVRQDGRHGTKGVYLALLKKSA